MADASFTCQVCSNVFSEYRVSHGDVDIDEADLACPKCGSTRVEPYHFDPNEPIVSPLDPADDEPGL